MKRFPTAIVLSVGLAAGACGSDSPIPLAPSAVTPAPSPAPAPASGVSTHWSGTFTDSNSFHGTFELRLSQSGDIVDGSWLQRWTEVTYAYWGKLSGSMSSTTLVATLTPDDFMECPVKATAAISGNRMTGTYTAVDCGEATISGSFELEKQ